MATQLGIRHMATVLPASDLERARRFYEEKLGLTPTDVNVGGLFYRAGDGLFVLYQAAGPASGQHTQAALMVDDLQAAMADLTSRGVTFEEYDIPTAHTEGGVMEDPEGRGAFFKDSEGNIVSLIEINADVRSHLGL